MTPWSSGCWIKVVFFGRNARIAAGGKGKDWYFILIIKVQQPKGSLSLFYN